MLKLGTTENLKNDDDWFIRSFHSFIDSSDANISKTIYTFWLFLRPLYIVLGSDCEIDQVSEFPRHMGTTQCGV